ncbi:NAD(P)/FAD-dependent oxidoreductase [Nocardioides sp. CER19]|uniref:flavin-containing monooxygenase n=1 Tax=Nocardioides sp. CER19 TaxID=3038538 RepID=UPI00244B411B|nr:NAD(P)/FAD-dependent oxidoreductase [Nocardioides sp. CER19]MDH2414855.1 NAD(P)/FAD-dependent oxidoreductase [Nocardioides sp. CER19]
MVSHVDTVVVGAGHAGLAVSRLLTGAGRDHVVLDRGRVAESWRSERWDSLRLLAPSWMCRLPGWRYDGPDQDGYLSAAELVRHLEAYAAAAPVETGRDVRSVDAADDGYRVVTDGRTWVARHVVIATGPTGRPAVPAGLAGLDPAITVLSPLEYRRPDALPPGGVLVVGASSSGVQIAEELALAGRRVVLAAGTHARMPRRYRGVDAYWWLERAGRFARTIDSMPDHAAARREPSFQLVGRSAGAGRTADLDLRTLQSVGVEVVGRFHEAYGHRIHVASAEELAATVASADARLHRFLDTADRHLHEAAACGRLDEWPAAPDGPADRPGPVPIGRTREVVDLRADGIATVIVATGYRPSHPWLQVPVTSPDGSIRQVRGVTPAPGLYVVGQRFQHRRDAASIDGARYSARDVVTHLCADDARGLGSALAEMEEAG